jgi:hypothetical protein
MRSDTASRRQLFIPHLDIPVTWNIDNADSRTLWKLFALAKEPDRHWRPEELGAILEHQMQSAVSFDLGGVEPELAPKLRMLAEAEGFVVRSLSDVLEHPRPPLELLILIQRFARGMIDHPHAVLPDAVARVIYFAAISAARVRCGERISNLDDEALAGGLRWALTRDWLTDSLRSLFQEVLDRLSPNEPPAPPSGPNA